MCGIICVVGKESGKNAINGLKHLSYRGYDSWGLVDSQYHTKHGMGQIGNFDATEFVGRVCIGHTRWATHGAVNIENCQPFSNSNYDIIFAHNGIITSGYLQRKDGESDSKAMFRRLLDYSNQGAKIEDIIKELEQVQGDNAFVLFYRGKVYTVTTGNKVLYRYLNTIGSDLNFLTDEYVICKNGLKEFNDYQNVTIPESKSAHMLDEIHSASDTKAENLEFPRETVIFGCGSSYNAALFGEYKFSNLKAIYAAQLYKFSYKYRDYDFLAISQSGETQDVIAGVDLVNVFYPDNRTRGYTNTKDSLITRLVDCSYMNVGVEYGVAATKTFAKSVADISGEDVYSDFEKLSPLIQKFVEENNFSNYIFLGEDDFFPLALEGELKLKEVAQVWTDAMIASEIKHGPIACVSDKTLVVIVSRCLTKDIIQNISQVKSRGAKVAGFISSKELDFSFSSGRPLGDNIIGCQLLAYWTAIKLKLDPDKPKNLAKCVTV